MNAKHKAHNIGFLISNCLYDGGAERVIANLSNQFIEDHINVVVITPARDEHDYYLQPSIKRYYYGDCVSWSSPRVIRSLKRIRYIREICKRENLDVLISFLPGTVTYGSIATLGIRTKSIASERNDPNRTYPTRMKRVWGKLAFGLANFSVFQTPDARFWFQDRVQKKSRIILNPVADVFYCTPRNPIPNLFVSCGRLVEQKNQIMLIEAFAIALKTNPDIRLNIYGEGYMHDVLQEKIDCLHMNEAIKLCGSTDDVPRALSDAEYFVLSSDFEGAPNALMEAMAMGIPSISTDCPCGGPRMLNNGEKVIELVPVGDTMALSDAICHLVQNKKLAYDLAEAGKIRSKDFTTGAVKEQWLDAIEKLVK